MADSKLKTKQFLSARGIPVPRLIATIRTRRELEKFDFDSLPESFVVKPNAGYGGEGIIVIKQKIAKGMWEKIGGGVIREEFLREHILDIVDGRYSIASLPDVALFEVRIRSIEFIPGLRVEGLPDIRVIVHNLIPVMAMLRIPTPESGGKANVHLGGIGLGIDLSSGKTTYAAQYNQLLDKLPGGAPVAGHKIPYWDKILLIATQAQLHTNLGYLAADIVIGEKEGPVLIELNARAGLMVQTANLAPLKKRLERIKGLSVDSPEKGVKLGQELFGRLAKKRTEEVAKNIVSYIEQGEIILAEGTHRVTAELDPTHETTAIDSKLAKNLQLPKVSSEGELVRLKLLLGGQRISTVAEPIDLSEADYKVILGRRDLPGFLIDPTPRGTKSLPKAEKKTEEFNYHLLDQRLMAIDSQLKLLYHLKPINLVEERKHFLASKHISPRFLYPAKLFDPLQLKAELKALTIPETLLGKIFKSKKIEIQKKIELIEAVATKNFTAASKSLYGYPTEDLLASAAELLGSRPKTFAVDEHLLTTEEAVVEFEKMLQKYNLKKWKVVSKTELVADVMVGKKNTIFIRQGAEFAPERLRATIAHEIETHVLRTENGKRQPYEIFVRGTANYLRTEEGLAVYNQNLLLTSESAKYYWPALNLLAVSWAAEHSFREVYNFVIAHGFGKVQAWKIALKVKRGLADTGKHGCFTREQSYFAGLQEIKEFVQTGGDLKKLYIGKISLSDLPLLEKLTEIKPAKLLPTQGSGSRL